MSNKLSVTGAIVSKNGVTLFTATGQSHVFGSESWRTAAILDEVMLPLAKSGGEPIEIDLDKFSLAKQIEAATGGALKVEEKIENGVSKIAIETASGARIENAEALEKQIAQVAVDGSPGLARFVERFGRLKHKHTADELLKFVQKMDLPIADDGCIVVYKFLDKKGGDTYADHHTGRVIQRLGSRVSMPLKNIDQSRDMCSSGLHVCSARYGNYGGAVLLAKVDPADVVSIPIQEQGKMRVSAYHLVATLDGDAHTAVSARKSALTAKGAVGVVANVIAGNHTAVLEEVVVGGSFVKDTNTPMTVKKVADETAPAAALNPVRPITEIGKIDPKQVKDRIKAATTGDMSAAVTAATQVPSPAPTGSEPLKIGDRVILDGKTEVEIVQADRSTFLVREKPADQTFWVGGSRIRRKPVQQPAPAVETPSPTLPSPEVTGTEPWAVAKPGDTVWVEGSSKIEDGAYVVDRVSNDGRSSRCRVKCDAYGSLGIANTLIKRIVATKAEAPAPVEAKIEKAVNEVGKAVKAIADATFDKATIYANKLKRATELHNAGKSLREIEKELKMCRKALSKHLKAA